MPLYTVIDSWLLIYNINAVCHLHTHTSVLDKVSSM